MNVELLGHATIIVRTSRTCIIFDPVLSDPFEDGAVTSYPPRCIDQSALPPLDAIVISHRHPDHLDVCSLASLPRSTPLICPKDAHILALAHAMDFRDIRVAHAGVSLSVGDLTLIPTASDFDDLPELGFLVIHSDGIVWNQVDTEIAPENAAALRRMHGPVSLHLARYASQNFEFFEDRRLCFPVTEHLRNLAVTVEIDAGCVVPASAGFCFAEPHAWLNAFMFPISPERFIAELRILEPSLHAVEASPGDVFGITQAGVEHCVGAAQSVPRTSLDPDLCRFDPSAPIPALADPNLKGRDSDELYRYLDRWVDRLTEWLSCNDSVPELYPLRDDGLAYRLEVIGPIGARWTWDLLIRSSAVDVWRKPYLTPVMTFAVAASIFADWLTFECSMYLLRAYRRTWSTALELSRDDNGTCARAVPFIDLPAAWLRAKVA